MSTRREALKQMFAGAVIVVGGWYTEEPLPQDVHVTLDRLTGTLELFGADGEWFATVPTTCMVVSEYEAFGLMPLGTALPRGEDVTYVAWRGDHRHPAEAGLQSVGYYKHTLHGARYLTPGLQQFRDRPVWLMGNDTLNVSGVAWFAAGAA